jgi:Tol biopolymer transport system component
MHLSAGTQLGPHLVVGPLGAGGMGEVYRATDTRLGRDVAIKVLPERLASDAGAMARFEREAKAVSSLNHPHICTLYDIGEEDGLHYLVMELVEGDTLSRLLDKGRLPLEEALSCASQIAAALTTAHRAGVVHRDLKPANVMLTKDGVKVLDFGLAKLDVAGSAHSSHSLLSTRAAGEGSPLPMADGPITAEGTILGTLAYMAPEQLEGKAVDGRADIFALGSLLYEMVTGQPAFDGESEASLIASILKDDPPPMRELQEVTPASLDHVMRRCLAKDPDERWQSASDVKAELAWAMRAEKAADDVRDASGRAPRGMSQRLVGTLALIAAMLVTGVTWILRTPEPVERRVERFVLTLEDPALTSSQAPAFSPDGSSLVYTQERTDTLVELSFETAEVRRIPGIEIGSGPQYSPDGEWIVYEDDNNQLRRVPARGGPSTLLTDGVGWTVGLALDSDGGAYFGAAEGKPPAHLNYLPAGASEPALVPGFADVEAFSPALSTDGGVLFVATRPADAGTVPPAPERCRIEALRLSDGRRMTVLQGAVSPTWSPSGHVLAVASGGTLTAVPFDVDAFEIVGDAVVVERPLRLHRSWLPTYALGRDGTLVYQTPASAREEQPLSWVAPDGSIDTPALSEEFRDVSSVRISNDGEALALIEQSGEVGQLWLIDIERGTAARHGDRKADWAHPVWSSDGEHAFATPLSRNDSEPKSIWRFTTDLTILPEKLLETVAHLTPLDVTADGRFLVYGEVNDDTKVGRIMLLDLVSLESTEYLGSLGTRIRGRLSPDGRFLAYTHSQDDSAVVIVRSFPSPGEPLAVSAGQRCGIKGWSADSTRVVYWVSQLGIGRVLRATIRQQPELELDEIEVLVAERPDVWMLGDYEPATGRLLWLGDAEAPPDQLILVRNFDEHLRRVAPRND